MGKVAKDTSVGDVWLTWSWMI